MTIRTKDQLLITDTEWRAAQAYFNDPVNVDSNKMRRPRNGQPGFGIITHSFLKVGEVIYAMDNKDSINSYEYGKYIGEGTFSKVSIVQTRNGDNFALKIEGRVHPDERRNELTIMKLLGRLIGTTVREGNKTLYFSEKDDIEVTQANYTVQSLIAGDELFYVLHQQELTKKQKLLIASKVLEQVQMLHDLQIIHIDIKPENFMCQQLGDDYALTIIDFAFSRILNADQTEILLHFFVGSDDYAAPETLDNYNYSFASDIYSTGVLLTKDLQIPLDPDCPLEAKLKKLLQTMQAPHPADRPALRTVSRQLQIVMGKYAHSFDNHAIDPISKNILHAQKSYSQKLNKAKLAINEDIPQKTRSLKGCIRS